MKRIIFYLVGVAVLIAMVLPAASPPVAADPLNVDFKQFANDWNKWIGSILNENKSTYYEGMSVPQRTIFTSIPSTTSNNHTLTFSHQATKGGIHAYDWLTAYNQGNMPPLVFAPCGEDIGPPADLGAICESLHGGSNWILVDVPDDPFISKDGSTQSRIDAYEAQYGNRQIKIYGNQPITAAALTLSHDVSSPGGDTGDSDIDYVCGARASASVGTPPRAAFWRRPSPGATGGWDGSSTVPGSWEPGSTPGTRS